MPNPIGNCAHCWKANLDNRPLRKHLGFFPSLATSKSSGTAARLQAVDRAESFWRYAVPCLLAVAATALYAMSMVMVHSYDALIYTYAARQGMQNLERLLHPHHLLYNSVGAINLAVWQSFGWRGDDIVPLQIMNAVFGGVCVALVYMLVTRYTRPLLALGAAMLLGLSHGDWLYSAEVEVYVLSVLFLVASLYAALRLRDRRWPFVLGILYGGAMLAHQTNVLFLPVLVLARAAVSPRPTIKQITIFAVMCALVVGIPYSLAAWLLGLTTPHSVWHWLTTHGQIGAWGRVTDGTVVVALDGLRTTIVAGSLPTSMPVRWIMMTLLVLISVGAYGVDRALARACMMWVVCYGIFFAWWEPANIEFWIAVLPPMVMMLALVLHALPHHVRTTSAGLLILLAVAVGWQNWTTSMQARQVHADDQRQQNVASIAPCVQTGGVVLVATSQLEPWLNYYGHIESMSIDKMLLLTERYRGPGDADHLLAGMGERINSLIRSRQPV